jgi:hypothetical protein
MKCRHRAKHQTFQSRWNALDRHEKRLDRCIAVIDAAIIAVNGLAARFRRTPKNLT